MNVFHSENVLNEVSIKVARHVSITKVSMFQNSNAATSVTWIEVQHLHLHLLVLPVLPGYSAITSSIRDYELEMASFNFKELCLNHIFLFKLKFLCFDITVFETFIFDKFLFVMRGTFKDFEANSLFSLARIEGTLEILGQFNEFGLRNPHGRFVSGRLETTGVGSISENFLCVAHYSLDFFNCVLETVGVAGRLTVSSFLPDCQAEQLEILITGRDDLLVGQLVGSARLLNPPDSPSLLQMQRMLKAENVETADASDVAPDAQAFSLGETAVDDAGSLNAQEMAEMGFMDLKKKRTTTTPPCSQGYPKILYASYSCSLTTISGFDVFPHFDLSLIMAGQFDTNGEMDAHGRFLQAIWHLSGNATEVIDAGYCAFEASGSQIVCTMIYSRLLSRFTLEGNDPCENVPQALTMRAFSGGPFYNASQAEG